MPTRFPPRLNLPQRYMGVRCRCGAYLVVGEARGEQRCQRLDQPAWIFCDTCGGERQFGRRDLIEIPWPPPPLS